jgi:hypothetical protein
MRLLGSFPTAAACAVTMVLLASCGSGHGSSASRNTVPPTSIESGSTTSAPSTTRATTIPTTGPTTAPAHGTTSTIAAVPPTSSPGGPAPGGPASTVHITDFRITPPSPVSCNAPTELELQWATSGATAVTLSIDGRVFAAYGPGPQDHLEPFACDGDPHTYTLGASAPGASTTASKTVTSR